MLYPDLTINSRRETAAGLVRHRFPGCVRLSENSSAPKAVGRKSSGRQCRQDGRGFTLFEVAISLVLVTFGVLSIMLIFPVGIKQQQLSRFKILASVKAMEMMDSFTGSAEFTRSMDPEVPEPWESNNNAYSSTRFDLESRLCNWHHGLLPVPTEIARRLDSSGEEIQQILGEGGALYYSQPMANTNLDERWMAKSLPNDALKIVCAISGYAQNNALPSLPWKEWPYRQPYPGPPIAAYIQEASMQSAKNAPTSGYNSSQMYSWEWWFGGKVGAVDQVIPPQVDPLLRDLFVAAEACNSNAHTALTRKAYVESALKYGDQTFLNSIMTNLPSPVTVGHLAEFSTYYTPDTTTATDNAALDGLGQKYDLAFAALCKSAEMEPADAPTFPTLQLTNKIKIRMDVVLRVQCMRFIAHSMMMLSMNNKLRDYDNSDSLVDTKIINGNTVTPGLLRYYHERCLAMVMLYAASFPYDWGAPRPAQRSIMMDHPLLEWDLFSPPRSGQIAGTTVPAAMWRPLAAQPVSNLGPAASYSGSYNTGTYDAETPPFPKWDLPMPNVFWGNPAHFTLTKPFSPKQRCRQIVFWAVDWQSYEDAETAPSAPLDASRAPLRGPRNPAGSFADRSLTQHWSAKETYQLMNPEYRLNFTEPVDAFATEKDITRISNVNLGEQVGGPYKTQPVLNGLYGADRNFNGLLDRGPVSRSVRMRATLIARFNYYDPRLPITLR